MNNKFPNISKKISGFTTNQSKVIVKKGLLTLALSGVVFGVGNNNALAAGHSNTTCIIENNASRLGNPADCGSTKVGYVCESFNCGIKGSITASSVNTTLNGHYSRNSTLLSGTPSIGHSSHGSHGSAFVY